MATRIDLQTISASSTPGTKKVHAQVRDKAENVSTSGMDEIDYVVAPVITTLGVSSVTVLNETKIQVNGNNFLGVTKVHFGAKAVTSNSVEDWHRGYFRVVSNTLIELFSPQALAPGTYAIKVENAVFQSNQVALRVTHNPMPHDPTTHVTKWTFPTLGLRGTLHFQALMLDPLNMHFMPIRTSTKDEVTLY